MLEICLSMKTLSTNFISKASIFFDTHNKFRSASELVTEAYNRECELDEVQAASQRLIDAENKESWADLDYYVIDSSGETVIIDNKLADQVEDRTYVPFNVLMRYSVHMWEHSLNKAMAAGWAQEIGSSGLYRWTAAYNGFLGYMAQLVQGHGVAVGAPE